MLSLLNAVRLRLCRCFMQYFIYEVISKVYCLFLPLTIKKKTKEKGINLQLNSRLTPPAIFHVDKSVLKAVVVYNNLQVCSKITDTLHLSMCTLNLVFLQKLQSFHYQAFQFTIMFSDCSSGRQGYI